MMLLASSSLPAPILWAACIENPDATAPVIPPNSQVLLDTSPMDADASAPRLPTIDASMYCITMDVICAIIAGILKVTTNSSCWAAVSFSPCRIRSNNDGCF